MPPPPSPRRPAPPPPALPAGIEPLTADEPRRVGPFRVVGRIGAGGMGSVYAALDDADRRAAVKCVHRVYAADSEFRERFAREVALVRRVRAACVPRFLDAAPRADLPWLATEYVAGPTLHEHVRTHGPLTGGVLVALAVGLAEALTAIHAAGVMHRDLKPGNVILSPDGPRVLDFGIARAAEETALTRTGGLVGTPGWIAPEQYRGVPASERSDMFAWGGLVAFAGTGRHPHGSGASDTMAARILSEPPDLEGVPDGLRGVVERALDKEPERRPDAVTAMREVSALLSPDESVTAVAGGGDVDVTRVLRQAWTGIRIEDAPLEEWRRCAPPRRSWWARRRVPLAVGAVGTALAVLVGTGAGMLAREGAPSGGVGDSGGRAPVQEAGTGQESVSASDVPEEYRDLYENGRVVVEPVSDLELVSSLVPASGSGEGRLEQLRITFEGAEYVGLDSPVLEFAVRVEYLPDFGEVRLHANDFARVGWYDDGQEYPAVDRPGSAGVVAQLGPADRTTETTVTFFGYPRAGIVYYLPERAMVDGELDPGHPGGVCYEMAQDEQNRQTPFRIDVTPYDVATAAGVPQDGCTASGPPATSP
ncbi:serine/threonine-protein kinase [Nocardiopsis sp. NPDC049922]|uniref:serine/threonine-protein kinase n=1 Tax=Nocardiopsis sp. NPDC049922 TaxID=3155157 RepID=UPI0034062009